MTEQPASVETSGPAATDIGEKVLEDLTPVWVRFKQICHIGSGSAARTVHPGEEAQIPVSHLNESLHEEIDGPTRAPAPPTDPHIAHFDRLESRLRALESAPLSWLHSHEARLKEVERQIGALNTPAPTPPPPPPNPPTDGK